MEEFTSDEAYTEDMQETPPKRGMSGWLIALIIVLALAAICLVCVCLALWLVGPAVGNTFSTIIETIEATTPMP
jgi:hypothetical protein